ncbi:MAG: PEP/pyruvate-binding domain-containing protein, partial [Trinickia sp.]
MNQSIAYVIGLEDLRREDVARVGGKNASLGELLSRLQERGVRVPPGFATTAQAYWRFIDANNLRERIAAYIEDLAERRLTLAEAGAAIRA